MAADILITAFVEFVFRNNKLLHYSEDVAKKFVSVSRRRFSNRMTAMDLFHDRELRAFLHRYKMNGGQLPEVPVAAAVR